MTKGMCVTKEPDRTGPLGKAWKMKADDSPAPTTIAAWLAFVPSAHPAWQSYAVAVVHLRPVEGVPPVHKSYPEAEYELSIWALHPDMPLDPDDPKTIGRALLTPVNVVEQFHGVTDAQAVELADMLVRSFLDGINSPDTDFRRRTCASIRNTVEHMALGGHPSDTRH